MEFQERRMQATAERQADRQTDRQTDGHKFCAD